MAECIHFESSFHGQPMERVFVPENGKEWIVRENWSVNFPNVVQKIIVKKREYFESYYYVDLEIVPKRPKCDAKILRSERMSSNKIEFLIQGDEYNCFEVRIGTDDDDNSENYAHPFQYKVVLTPIFQFINENFRKPGKRTKIDLLEGLKKLSDDVSSLRNDEHSDVVICCGDKQVKAHRNILSARSTLFKKLLQNAIKDEEFEDHFEMIPEITFNSGTATTTVDDSNITKIKLKNISPSVFDEFIDFIYSGRYKTFEIKRAKDLLIAARNYGIYDLENKCIVYLNSKLSTEVIEDIYNFACECSCEKLQTCVLDYAKNKIFGKKRTKVHPIVIAGNQVHPDDANEEEITECEKMKWLEIMRNHATYLKNIPNVKKNRKIIDALSMCVPDTNTLNDDNDDGTANCEGCVEDNLRTCADDVGDVQD